MLQSGDFYEGEALNHLAENTRTFKSIRPLEGLLSTVRKYPSMQVVMPNNKIGVFGNCSKGPVKTYFWQVSTDFDSSLPPLLSTVTKQRKNLTPIPA